MAEMVGFDSKAALLRRPSPPSRNLAPSAVVSALADRTVRQRLAALGQEIRHAITDISGMSLAALQKAKIEKWWPIVKAAKIKAE